MNATTEKPKATLSKPTELLFWLAARSHSLAEQFGVQLIDEQTFRCGTCHADLPHADEDCPKCGSKVAEPTGAFKERLKIFPQPRPWLTPVHPSRPNELTFNPEVYAKSLSDCSEYTEHMRRFILNVWLRNPTYAKTKGWEFDLFKAMRGLDSNNLDAVAFIIRYPQWP